MKVRIFLACAMAVAGARRRATRTSSKAAAPPRPTRRSTITQANPPPGGTWADVVNATSAGFMMGNPNAKVKLVEIGSLSCPHCKAFEEEGVPTLIDKYVKTGTGQLGIPPVHHPRADRHGGQPDRRAATA